MRHRHADPLFWLLIRRTLERTSEVKHYLSNAACDTPLRTIADVTSVRWRVEESFEDGKGQLGRVEYEARLWTSWHHHLRLVALAHLFVTQTRRDLKRKSPALTLDMALRLIRAAMPRPHLSLEEAEKSVKYHQDRNDQATRSHRKTWRAKHLGFDSRKCCCRISYPLTS